MTPYAVAPLSSLRDGVRAGDPADVTVNGRTPRCVIGDFGPAWGEISVAAVITLGIPIVDVPRIGPVANTSQNITVTVTVHTRN